MEKNHSPYHIGLRNVNTAFAATLCALLYYPTGHNPTFACIGAIFGMGSDMNSSMFSGFTRLFGTIFGGFIGIFLYSIYLLCYPDGSTHFLLFVLLFIGVNILIIFGMVFEWPNTIQPGGVVLCIVLLNTEPSTYVTYSAARIADTAVGVLVALAINLLLPRERVDKWSKALHQKFHIKK